MSIENLNEWGSLFIEYLLHISVQGCMFFLVIAGFSWLLRNKSATFQYILWSLALIRFLIPPQLPAVPAIETAIPEISSEIVFRPVFVALSAVESPILNWQSYFLMVWACGVLASVGFLFWTNYKFSQTLKSAQPLNFGLTVEKNEGWTKHLKVQLMLLPGIEMPFTYGLFRPKIYLPEADEDWSHEELKFVVAHEMAHIRRGDLFVIQLQALVQVLFFFHPCVWLANYFANYYRELACDDFSIVQSGGRVVDYSKILLNNLTRIRKKQVACTLTSNFGKNRSILFRRFKHILTKKEEIMLNLSVFQKFIIVTLTIFAIAISCEQQKPTETSDVTSGIEVLTKTDASDHTDNITTATLVGGIEALGELIKYPEEAKKKGIEGKVIAEFVVTKEGTVKDVKIIQSSSSFFNQIVIDGIMRSKWNPATEDGKPIQSTFQFPFVFANSDDEPNPVGGLAAIQANIRYPKVAQLAGVEGRVTVKVLVGANGEVLKTEIIRSLGNNGCDEAAVAAIKSVKWNPGTKKGDAVEKWAAIPVVFELDHLKAKSHTEK